MTRHYFRPIKEETVVSVLRYVREEILRDGLDGIEHVEALLEARGVAPDSLPVAAKTPKAFKRGELRRMVMDALRDGPQTGAEIAKAVHAQMQDLTYQQVYKRVYVCLWQMKGRGVVVLGGGVWLAP
ncbi:hypothetical protein [Actibacterium sp.]|uniref:hypothetical protein n=1 Tax=Actibacterium sp. TaxID=1872125 RepID=UPI0035663215